MSKFGDEAADYDVVLVRESVPSWLVRDDEGEEHWLPKSQCEFPSGCRAGQTVSVTIPNWLAEDRGLA